MTVPERNCEWSLQSDLWMTVQERICERTFHSEFVNNRSRANLWETAPHSSTKCQWLNLKPIKQQNTLNTVNKIQHRPRSSRKPRICENRIPMVIASWWHVPMAPRIFFGEISAKYNGHKEMLKPGQEQNTKESQWNLQHSPDNEKCWNAKEMSQNDEVKLQWGKSDDDETKVMMLRKKLSWSRNKGVTMIT